MFKCSWDWREGRHVKFQLMMFSPLFASVSPKFSLWNCRSRCNDLTSYKYISTWIQISEEHLRTMRNGVWINVLQVHVVFANPCSFQFHLDKAKCTANERKGSDAFLLDQPKGTDQYNTQKETRTSRAYAAKGRHWDTVRQASGYFSPQDVRYDTIRRRTWWQPHHGSRFEAWR